jgi:hypothetical protein
MQTWTPVAILLLQHRNKGVRVLFHPGIGLGFNREQHCYSRSNLQNQILSIRS